MSAAAVAVKAERPGPLYAKTFLKIERNPKVNLIVEAVKWNPDFPVVIKVAVLVLGRNGNWFASPKTAEIRLSEAKAVAVAIARAYKEHEVTE